MTPRLTTTMPHRVYPPVLPVMSVFALVFRGLFKDMGRVVQ
jgi:hypothetical protein